MRNIKEFLNTSTIHGLYFISKSKGWSRLFWILVVYGGFFGAGYMIYESFNNWDQSPIATTVETLPISELTLPNVTICPPKNSFLNLNYDIIKAEEKFNESYRKEFINQAIDSIQKSYFDEIRVNIRQAFKKITEHMEVMEHMENLL